MMFIFVHFYEKHKHNFFDFLVEIERTRETRENNSLTTLASSFYSSLKTSQRREIRHQRPGSQMV